MYFLSVFQVDDQMKLLQNSWSDMLVLDHIHQRLHNQLPDETTLHNGQKFDLLGLGLLGVPSLADHFSEIQQKLQELKFDVGDYICMKFLLLLNPGNRCTEGESIIMFIFKLLFFLFSYCNIKHSNFYNKTHRNLIYLIVFIKIFTLLFNLFRSTRHHKSQDSH